MANELHFAGNAAAARETGFIARVKAALFLAEDVPVEFRAIHSERDGCTVEYALSQPVPLQGREFGVAEGVVVDESAIASLRFDAAGKLLSANVRLSDPAHLRAIQGQVRRLAAADEIDPSPTGPTAAMTRSPARRRQWFVEVDPHGRRRLRRAFFS